MPRGLPDYYNPSTLVSSRMVDLTSVFSAAMGIPPLDGRGRIMWIDTFGEGVSAWRLDKDTDGVAAHAYGGFSEIAPLCAALGPGTKAKDGFSGIIRDTYLGTPTSLGFEIGFWFAGNNAYIQQEIQYFNNSQLMWMKVRIYGATGEVKLVHKTGEALIADLQSLFLSRAWYTSKLVVDPVSKRGVRWLLGPTQYDISDYQMFTGSGTYNLYTSNTVYVHPVTDGAQSVYLGHAILTIEEP